MTKLPKVGGQRLSGNTESNNLQVVFVFNYCVFDIELKKLTIVFEFLKFYIQGMIPHTSEKYVIS